MTQDPDAIARPTRAFELEISRFEKIARVHGWVNDDGFLYGRIAAELGISQRTAYRVVDREIRPQVPFLAGLMDAVEGLSLHSVVRIVDADDPIGKD